MDLRLSLSAPDLRPLLDRAGQIVPGAPDELTVDHRRETPTEDWISRWAPEVKRELRGGFQRPRRWVGLWPGDVVKLGIAEFPRRLDDLLAIAVSFPFELAVVNEIYPEWGEEPLDYAGPGFGFLHFPHGPMCAFRGAGHGSLVSRRWLDFGPWRTIRRPGDVTVVQFHDLDADARTALAQAAPGHERMGATPSGGFLQRDRPIQPLGGLYTAPERRLRVLVHGRPVPQREMLDACSVRRWQALGPDRPIDHVAYVFAVESEARAHLHELWLRDLECWTFVNGRETRIDLDHHPTPVKPEWVVRLEEAESSK